MDQLGAMALFVEVADAGSLSGAGRRLRLPLTTVSRRLADLEGFLGVRLLNRSTRKVSLTPAGVDYLTACRRILDEVFEAGRAAAGEYSAPRGELTISAPLVFGRLHVLPTVAEFLQAFPEISVRLLLADRMAHLLEEHLDLAVRIAHLPDSGMMATRIGTIRRVTCASPGYIADRGRPETPEDLRGHDCIAFDGLTTSGAWMFGSGASELLVPIRWRLAVSTAEAAVDAAVAGLGITRVLSYQIEEAQRQGRLVTVLDGFEPPAWPVHLLRAGQPRVPLKTRACIDFLAPRLKHRLAGLAGAADLISGGEPSRDRLLLNPAGTGTTDG